MGFLILTIIGILMIATPIILVKTDVIDCDSLIVIFSCGIGIVGTFLFGMLTPSTYFSTKQEINEIIEYKNFIENAKDTEISQAVVDAKKIDANTKIAELKAAKVSYPAFCWCHKEIDALEYFN